MDRTAMTDADLDALTRDAAALPPGPYEVVQHGGGNCAVLAAGEMHTPGERIAFLSESWRRSPEAARGLADALARVFSALASGIFARFAETIRQERAARRAAEVEVAKLRAELEVRRASDRRPTLFRASGAFRCTDGGKPVLHVPNKVENGLGSNGYQYRDLDAVCRALAVVPGETRQHPRDGEYVELIPLDEVIAKAVKAAEARKETP